MSDICMDNLLRTDRPLTWLPYPKCEKCSLPFTNKLGHPVHRLPFLLDCQHLMCGSCLRNYPSNDAILCELCHHPTLLQNDIGEATIALHPSYYIMGLLERKQEELENIELYYVDETHQPDKKTTGNEPMMLNLTIVPVTADDISTPQKLKNLLAEAYRSYESTKNVLEKGHDSNPDNVDQVIKKINGHFLSLHNALQVEENRVLQQVRKSFLEQRQHNERQQHRLQTSKDRLGKLYARAKRFLNEPPAADDRSWQKFGKEVKLFLESEPLKLRNREGNEPKTIFYTERDQFLRNISKSYKLTLPELGKVMQLIPMAASADSKYFPPAAGTSIALKVSTRYHSVADRTFTNESFGGMNSPSSSRAQLSAAKKKSRSERGGGSPNDCQQACDKTASPDKISLTKRVSRAKKSAEKQKDIKRYFTTVKVTCVVNPHEFYVQDELHLESTKTMVELCQHEAEAYETNLIAGIDPLNIRIGMLYLVRSELSANWYRALVLDSLNATPEERGPYRVQFVDYGGQATVTHVQVRPMSKELANIEGRAIRCSLYNVAPVGWKPDNLSVFWSEDSRVMMMDFVANHNMVMFEVTKHSGTLMVDMFQPPITSTRSLNKCSRKNEGILWEGYYAPMSLRNALVFEKHCILTEANETRRHGVGDRLVLLDLWLQKAKAQSMLRFHIPEAPKLPEFDCFDVQVTHSLSPEQFYLMPMRWKTNHFESLQKQLNELCQGERKCFVPYVGLVCGFALGEQSSKVWFRGRIEKLLRTGQCEVFVLDSGELLTVHRCDLFLLPPESAPLLKHPLALCCRLEHIYAKKEDFNASRSNYGIIHWTQSAMQEFNQIVSSKTLRFSVKMGRLCNVTNMYSVVLYLHNKTDRDTCINKLLVSKGHAECIAGKEMEIEDRMLRTEADLMTPVDAPNGTTCVQPSKLVDPRVMVEMLKVVSPGELYVRVCARKPCLERLHQTIQQHMIEALDGNVEDVDDSASGGGCNWSVGDMCVVFTSTPDGDFNEWYRARITAVQEEGVQYEVFLIDRAETVQVHRTNMARLTSNVSQIQPGAVRCRLACIEPIGGSTSWHKTTLDALLNTIESYDKHAISLDAKIPNKSDDAGRSISVVLWGIRQTTRQALAPQRTEYRNINQLLVVRGLAHSTGRFRTFATKGAGALEEVQLFEQTVDEMMRSEYEKLQQFFRSIAAVSTYTQEYHSGEDGNETAKTLLNAEESDVKVDIDDACAAALALIDVPIDHIPDWPEGVRFDKTVFIGMPTHIGNDGTVFIYDVCQEPVLTRMRDIINEYVQNSSLPKSVAFRVGEPCFVKFHMDGNFYRGKVLLVIEPYRTYRVLFVDYGNEETCSVQDLRPATICGLVPVQANRFRLSGIIPTDYCSITSLWPEDALVMCHGLFVQKLCKVRVDASIWSEDAWKDATARHLPIPCHLTLLKDSIDVSMVLMKLQMFKLRSEQPAKRNNWLVKHIPPRKSEVCVTIAQPSTSYPASTNTAEHNDLLKFMEEIQAEYAIEKEFEDPNELPEEEDEHDRLNRAQLINLELLVDDDNNNEKMEESVREIDSPLPSPASFDSNELETSSRLSAQEHDESLELDSIANSDDPVARSFPYQPPIKPSTIGFYADFTNYGDDLTLHVYPHMEGHTMRMALMDEKVQTVAMSRNQLHRWQATVLETGAPCLAPYRVDGKYYRAIVEEIDESRDEVRVLYVDYLNRDTVAKTDLRKCPIGLRMIPLRNIMVRLAGVRSNSRLRIEDVNRRLVDHLKQPFYVRVVQYPAKTDKTVLPEVELYTDYDCKRLVYQKMLDTKYFLATTPRK
uniref:RING finger protein 17 n=1 Tax=Anopheles christyi TaxID=43041 RepID=A0A182JXP3_9DIPT